MNLEELIRMAASVRTLDDKIREAARRGERYTPSQREWDEAPRYQRQQMTWPAHVIAAARRSK